MAQWIFQGNPDSFNLTGYLTSRREIVWSVGQRHLAPEMGVGDRVYFWRAAGTSKAQSGVIAEAVIVDQPSVRGDDEAAGPFWIRSPGADERLRVGLRVLRVANDKEVIRREWLKDDPVLHDLRILKLANETSYRLPPEQAERLATLWRNTNRDWDRAETVAGLWAYCKTLNTPISKLPDSPVSEVALRIARAVPSVYNKVMNFRALDPLEPRSGFSGGGALAAQVWTEFFDAEAGAIRWDDLDAEYNRLWRVTGPSGKTSPLHIPVESAWNRVRAAAEAMLARGDVYESQIQGQRYQIQSVEAQKIRVTRLDSEKPEYLSVGDVERGVQKLNDAGGRIRRREINYTVAKEVTLVALHPGLKWSADGDWIEAVAGTDSGPSVAPTYTDFGQAPDDDPEELIQFARRVRAGQPKFRQNLLLLYNGACAICRSGPSQVLEAAHILLHARSGLNHTDNGILLRSDLHTLFDDGLLRIHPESLVIEVDTSLRDTPYWVFHGSELAARCDGGRPSPEHLRVRWMAKERSHGAS